MQKIVITGGAGFIGSHVVRLFVKKYPNYNIINLDKLTYAGNLANLKDIEHLPNYRFIKGDIIDTEFINNLFEVEQPDAVIHLAAESHVDRSITNPLDFVMTNVVGTANLLNAARHNGKAGMIKPAFTMFQPMRFMAVWVKMECLQKKPVTIRTRPIRHQKQAQIIS
jgi:dTDP-glucose 4,6-dehydratase